MSNKCHHGETTHSHSACSQMEYQMMMSYAHQRDRQVSKRYYHAGSPFRHFTFAYMDSILRDLASSKLSKSHILVINYSTYYRAFVRHSLFTDPAPRVRRAEISKLVTPSRPCSNYKPYSMQQVTSASRCASCKL